MKYAEGSDKQPSGLPRNRVYRSKSLYSTKRYGKIVEKGEEKMKEIEFVPTNYPSDLTDSQWAEIEEYFPQGINSTHHKRSLINGVLYLVDNGCKWRALPHDFPPYSTVHSFYRRARLSGLWEKVLDAVIEKIRAESGKNPTPSYGLIDSQSVKTIYVGGAL